ncbi:MAG: 4Fe-4S binding protein [Oscillospiraceae bacterium]|nr:4Fe-4S binding protein [Oscillospiraceae bacterium]MCR4761879.1 4Fe-4S binding protein [Oscillospiraceae bacterium]
MNEVIIVKPEKCVGCTACIRACPAPEANVTRKLSDGRFITSVDPDRCIACGECISACTHGARDYIDDTEDAMAAIARDEKPIIMVMPEIKAAYPTKWKGILDWFRSKGCDIYDVSFGADICTWAHLRAMESGQINHVITQPCSAIVRYIELYQPKLLTNLSPIHSPIACSVIYIKEYQRRDNPIAVLSACVAKKNEFSETGLVDFSITFRKMMEYFDRSDIRIATNPVEDYEYKFDDVQGSLGSIYSRPGGLKDNLLAHEPDLDVVSSEGVQKVYRELEMYAKLPEQKLPQVFDVMSCEFGCNIGPGSESDQTGFDVMNVMRAVEREASGRRKISNNVFRGSEDKLFRRFDEELRLSDFIRSYKPCKPSAMPADAQLDKVFESMGMQTDEQRCFDCNACGYRSCREMATAIFRGLNTPENCIFHTKKALANGGAGGEGGSAKMAEFAGDCRGISEKMQNTVSAIAENIERISNASGATGERADMVNELLRNVVAFCNSNPVMDEGSVKQLVSILETTSDALGALGENVAETDQCSESISGSVEELKELLESLNLSAEQLAAE